MQDSVDDQIGRVALDDLTCFRVADYMGELVRCRKAFRQSVATQKCELVDGNWIGVHLHPSA